jgi:hypothetical protein
MNRTIGALALAAVVVGGACSESKSVKPAAVTASAATTTTVPAEAPTSAPSAPTTTIPFELSPQVIAENEVRAAWTEITSLSDECYAQPTTCQAHRFAIEPALSSLNTRIANDYVALGRHVEVNEADPAYDTVDGVRFDDDGETVTIDRCYWSTSIVVQDEPRVIVNDLKTTYHSMVRLRRVDGVWYTYQFRSVGSPVTGRNDCGPRP